MSFGDPTPQQKIERVWTDLGDFNRSPRPLSKLFFLVLAVHGPLDVGITAAAWSLESNAVVLVLGLIPWLLAKILLLSAAVFVWFDAAEATPWSYVTTSAAWLGFLLGLGVALILPNVAVVLGVIAP